MSSPRSDTTVLLVCVTALVTIVVIVAGLVYVFAPPDTDPTVLAATLVGTLAPTIAAMAAVVKVGSVSSQVADVAEDTNKLANGLGDSKVRAAMGDVLHPDLVNPDARDQLQADRARRDANEDHR